MGKWVIESTAWNIDEYAAIRPSDILKDKLHLEYEEWILSNTHLCWPPWA